MVDDGRWYCLSGCWWFLCLFNATSGDRVGIHFSVYIPVAADVVDFFVVQDLDGHPVPFSIFQA